MSPDEKISRDVFEKIITITPKNERDIPEIFFLPNVSFKNNAERIAIKMTFVLMRTAEVDAFVYFIPTN